MSWSADNSYRKQMETIFGYFQKPIQAQNLQSKKFEVKQPSLENSSTRNVFLAILRSDMGSIQIIAQGFSSISYIDFSGKHAVKSPLIALKMNPSVFRVVLRDRAVIQGPDPQQAAEHTMCQSTARHHCVKICSL